MVPPTVNSMLDWPEQIQTSPTRTSSKVTVLLPVTTSLKGPPAFWAGRSARQAPSAPAVVPATLSPRRTSTFSPGSPQPQTGMGISRCKTM